MRKIVLFTLIFVINCFGLMAQELVNYLKNGNFEEQGAWEIVTVQGDASDLTWEFGSSETPDYGEGKCLNVSYTAGHTLRQYLVQKITLTVGDSYKFEGAFKDVGTSADAEFLWHQIIIWPATEDLDLTNGLQAGPSVNDETSSILINHARGWGKDWLGLGKNTTFEADLNPDWIYAWDKVGLGNNRSQGDTTVYTVPEVMDRWDDDLVLGEIGDEVEYYFIYQIGQYIADGSGKVNTFNFSFDEFKLMGPAKTTTVEEDKPNYLKNGDFEEQGAWEIVTVQGDASDLTWEFGSSETPDYGEGKCLNVSYTAGHTLRQYLVQKITLTVGDSYKFEGAFKDVGTSADAEFLWHQIIIWPATEDLDLTNGLQAGPSVNDETSSILINHARGWGKDWLGLGKNTTFEADLNPDWIYAWDKVGLGNNRSQGDTTVYTVPEVMDRWDDDLVLGEIGDEVEYYFIYQIGQYIADGSGKVNTFNFSFDEFKLMKLENDITSVENNLSSKIELMVYPNPASTMLIINGQSDLDKDATLEIYSLMGRKVYETTQNLVFPQKLDISSFQSGSYIIRLKSKENVETLKFIKL